MLSKPAIHWCRHIQPRKNAWFSWKSEEKQAVELDITWHIVTQSKNAFKIRAGGWLSKVTLHLQCQHPTHVLIWVLVVSLLIQLSAYSLGKHWGMIQLLGGLYLIRDPEKAPGFKLWTGFALAIPTTKRERSFTLKNISKSDFKVTKNELEIMNIKNIRF